MGDAFGCRQVSVEFSLPNGSNIVDFGCGSCGLTLPLAYTFPNFNFIGVDIKSEALILMNNRAKAANQTKSTDKSNRKQDTHRAHRRLRL